MTLPEIMRAIPKKILSLWDGSVTFSVLLTQAMGGGGGGGGGGAVILC